MRWLALLFAAVCAWSAHPTLVRAQDATAGLPSEELTSEQLAAPDESVTASRSSPVRLTDQAEAPATETSAEEATDVPPESAAEPVVQAVEAASETGATVPEAVTQASPPTPNPPDDVLETGGATPEGHAAAAANRLKETQPERLADVGQEPPGGAAEQATGTVARVKGAADGIINAAADRVVDRTGPALDVGGQVAEIAEMAEPTVELAPALDAATPLLELADPALEAATPLLELADPALEAATPLLELADPALDAARPLLELADPALEAARPLLELADPALEAATPLLELAADPTEPLSPPISPTLAEMPGTVGARHVTTNFPPQTIAHEQPRAEAVPSPSPVGASRDLRLFTASPSEDRFAVSLSEGKVGSVAEAGNDWGPAVGGSAVAGSGGTGFAAEAFLLAMILAVPGFARIFRTALAFLPPTPPAYALDRPG